jgi:hypothetical protein
MTPSESGGSGGTTLTLSKRYSAGCATTTPTGRLSWSWRTCPEGALAPLPDVP